MSYQTPDLKKVEALHAWFNLLGKYHKHKVVGGENLPKQGRVLLVFNHSLATYDMSILVAKIRELTGRVVMQLGDDMWFKIPILGDFIKQTGSVRANPETATELLENEEMVLVAPGGMREALKPSTEKNRLIWEKRKGFIRLAIQTQTPIILCACPEADNIYTVYETQTTKWIYKKFKLPVLLYRGLGPSFFPRPVDLIHYISKPLTPPKVDVNDEAAFNRAVDDWHSVIQTEMEKMLEENARKNRLKKDQAE